METTMKLFYDLGHFVDKVFRGQTQGTRATDTESMLDVMPADARQIVYGLAFTQWTGAKLRTFALLVGRRWYPLFFRVMQTRLEKTEQTANLEAEYEREALIDLLDEFKRLHPNWTSEIEMILRAHRHELVVAA